jgi:hypothetical protein
MENNKAREVNNPIIKQLLDETSPEELAKIDTEMTNNKQQTAMKLYTEEQLTRYLLDEGIMELSDLANNLVPCIELPSDEEIQKESLKSDFEYTFRNGAKWMRDKIQGGEL